MVIEVKQMSWSWGFTTLFITLHMTLFTLVSHLYQSTYNIQDKPYEKNQYKNDTRDFLQVILSVALI